MPRRLVSDRVYFARQSSFVMTLRRITTTTTATTNLPSIRVHDHHIHNMDMSSESYRSRPLAIPAPRNISPTSSRASSFHDQPHPPPLLSLLPPSNPPEERQASWKDSDDGGESVSHRWFGDARDRQPSSHPISSPRGWGSFGRRSRGPRHASPGSFEELNIKREPSQSWPDDFRGRQKPPSQLNKELSRPALLKSILLVTSTVYTCHKN